MHGLRGARVETRVKPAWHVLTGEYPPKPGGVADYTRAVVRALAVAGEDVHVWTPRGAAPPAEDEGVRVHVLERGFTPRGLLELKAGLGRERSPRRLLVQYVPHAFGMKAMNLPFCAWLAAQQRDASWVMLHEVAFPLRRRDPLRHQLIGVVTHVMAALVAGSAARIFVSTPAWNGVLARFLRPPPPTTWLPIPSNLPTHVAPNAIARARARLPPGPIVGHFGTYGLMAPVLSETLRLLLAKPGRTAVLMGRGSLEFAKDLNVVCGAGSSVLPMGTMSSDDLAAMLAACDVVVQPYSDGVTTRRTSLMASLALGVPIVTTLGVSTETVWTETGSVVLGEHDALALVAATEALLDDVARRDELSDRGKALYERVFSLERTIATLREAPSLECAGKPCDSAPTTI